MLTVIVALSVCNIALIGVVAYLFRSNARMLDYIMAGKNAEAFNLSGKPHAPWGVDKPTKEEIKRREDDMIYLRAVTSGVIDGKDAKRLGIREMVAQ